MILSEPWSSIADVLFIAWLGIGALFIAIALASRIWDRIRPRPHSRRWKLHQAPSHVTPLVLRDWDSGIALKALERQGSAFKGKAVDYG